MAVIYIRVSHYIASYLRNIDDSNPIPVGQPFVFDDGDPLYRIVTNHIQPNQRSVVNSLCFSELQWNAMLHGKYLVMNEGLRMDVSRDYRQPLTISEIFLLSGNESRVHIDPITMERMPDNDYPDEYICVRLPRYVVRGGRELRVYSNWFLPDASYFRAELSARFMIALVRYVSKEYSIIYNQLLDACTLTVSDTRIRMRAKAEAIDRFMMRYDIRPDERSRELIKKLLRRSRLAAQYSINNSIEHGEWSPTPQVSIPARPNRPTSRPVICRETGVRYKSIREAAVSLGVAYDYARSTIARGVRCHGFTLQYIKSTDSDSAPPDDDSPDDSSDDITD